MKKHNAIILSVIGIIAIVAGILMTSVFKIDFGSLKVFPYLLSGIGCAVAGYGIVEVIEKDIMKESPDVYRQMQIDEHDERNVMIQNAAKAKAFDVMQMIFLILIITVGLMGELTVTLLMVICYLSILGLAFYYRKKMEKEN